MRIPLSVKLLFSYLLIVIIAAGPTFLYVRAKLETELMSDSAAALIARARRMGHAIAAAAPAERLAKLQFLGGTSLDRLTFLSPHGEVLYDNEIADVVALENHLGRPEVSYALGNTLAPRLDFLSDVRDVEGVGIARRVSVSNGVDTLYIAIGVTMPQSENIGVLRLAAPVNRIGIMTSRLVRFARNAQAMAVSLAIGFALLAAIFWIRPLQRVGILVQALASGDLGAQVGRLGNDEVGDIGRALEQMALSLRRRLLAAGLGEAMLSQFVEALPVPCVIFEERGDVVALNGPARHCLGIEGPEAGRRMKDLAAHPLLKQAVQTAEHEGEPEPIALPLDDGLCARGCMHVLKRPGTAPLRVFIGADLPPPETSILPAPEQVQPQDFVIVWHKAKKSAEPVLRKAGINLEISPQISNLLLADARHQLGEALGEALIAAVPALSPGQSTLRLEVHEEATRLRIRVGASISRAAIERIAARLAPLGGSVDIASGETTLWLPRA